MFFQKYQQQKRRKFIRLALLTGIASGLSGFLFSHFFNPKSGEQNRKEVSKEADKAVKYAEKTRNELLAKAKKMGEDFKSKAEEVKDGVESKAKKVESALEDKEEESK